ncbi:homocysteine S-methyltransferase family protein [Burkholderia sp. Bp8963]|uniref:homocysteine S-methyltransferase family protein n=1 Tax=Burkholderia sp. Bp8963 TaxID=2184547 RepID=UPI0021AB450E|nr:homocysteine S-methyltransferase family protein [Burkholderia sp. Bp8963]
MHRITVLDGGTARELTRIGARFVGGCCGIGRDPIAALRDAVDARRARRAGAAR